MHARLAPAGGPASARRSLTVDEFNRQPGEFNPLALDKVKRLVQREFGRLELAAASKQCLDFAHVRFAISRSETLSCD